MRYPDHRQGGEGRSPRRAHSSLDLPITRHSEDETMAKKKKKKKKM
jgi:hypothetical protein